MLIDSTFLILVPAVFGASMLQAATGIGYGVIAGPIFLIVLNGSQAFQISTAHNLLIALMLAPVVYSKFDKRVLKFLVLGSCLSIPAGFLVLQLASIVFLKLFSAAIVAFTAGVLAINMVQLKLRRVNVDIVQSEQFAVGLIAGFMAGILAMPGPIASTWMSVRGWNKETVRSTILMFFIFAYGTTAIFYMTFSEVSSTTISLSLILGPVVVLGTLVGNLLSRYLSEVVFRNVLLVVLVLTVASLIISI